MNKQQKQQQHYPHEEQLNNNYKDVAIKLTNLMQQIKEKNKEEFHRGRLALLIEAHRHLMNQSDLRHVNIVKLVDKLQPRGDKRQGLGLQGLKIRPSNKRIPIYQEHYSPTQDTTTALEQLNIHKLKLI